jgi:hypothetical protein
MTPLHELPERLAVDCFSALSLKHNATDYALKKNNWQ